MCLFGSLAIAFYGFLSKALTPICLKLIRLLDKKLEEYGIDLIEFEPEVKEAEVCDCENCPLKIGIKV